MATGKKGSITLRGAFPAGTRVGLYERRGDTFAPGDTPVQTARVNKDSEVQFTGLDDGAPFFAAAEVDGQLRDRRVTAKIAAPGEQLASADAGIHDKNLSINARKNTRDRQKAAAPAIVTGPRGTKAPTSRGHVAPGQGFSDPTAGLALDSKAGREAAGARMVGSGLIAGEEVPHDGSLTPDGSRLEDAPENVPLASDTYTGQVEPAPTQGLKQQDVPKGTKQLSDTEYGQAAPIPDGIPERQEDSDGLPQLSDTPHGTTAPVPPTRLEVAKSITPEKGSGPGEPQDVPPEAQPQKDVKRNDDTDKKTATRLVAGRQSQASPSSSPDITPVGKGEVKRPAGGKPVATAKSGQKAAEANRSPGGEGPRPRRSGSSGRTKAQRSAAAKKAAATRKRNQRKGS